VGKAKNEKKKLKKENEIEIEIEILNVKLKLTIIIIKCLIFAVLCITFRREKDFLSSILKVKDTKIATKYKDNQCVRTKM